MRRNFTKPAALPLLILASALVLTACGGGDPEDRQFGLAIHDRKMTLNDGELVVKQGDSVSFLLDTDESGVFHLHGYDIEKELTERETVTMEFVAGATGRFMITFHAEIEGGHSAHTAHGAVFESDTLQQGDSFSYRVMHDMNGQTLPYHNHMNHEMIGSIMVSDTAQESGVAHVSIQEDGSFSPAMLSVQPGTEVTWTNMAAQRQRVASGDPPTADGGHDAADEEVTLGALEVRPR